MATALLSAVLFMNLFVCQDSAVAATNQTTSAAREQERFNLEEKVKRTQTSLQSQEEEAPIEVETNPAPEGPGAFTDEAAFPVNKIVVTGNTVLPESEIRALTQPYEGKMLRLAQAKEIAAKITQVYRAKTYVTCRAYIPPQNVDTKTLEIRVLEGKIGMVHVRGNKFFKKDNITRFLKKSRGKVMNYTDLKRNITKMNLHPDREVKAVIVPGKTVGTSDLILDVEDRFPLHIGGEINNYGTKLTGRERYSVSIRHTNLLGMDDILAARFQFGEEVLAVGTQYAAPVGPWDTQAGVSFNYTDVSVGGDFSVLDISGKAYGYSVFVNQPVYDGEKLDLTATGAFESKTIKNELLGTPSSQDDLRMIRAGLNAELLDKWGRTFFVNDLTFGMPWLGASDKNDPLLSRTGAGTPFFKYNGSLNRIHPVYDSTYALFKSTLQLTPARLVSAEQYDIGGVYSVRGYPQSDYLGDSGIGAGAEIRVPWYFIPRDVKFPGDKQPLWNKINFVGFLDGAHATLRNPAVGEAKSKNYVGIGGGLRFDLPHNLTGRFEYAAPIGDDPTDHSDGQFYFSISGDLV